jgi:ferric-dicitrate binding protein FerR (iron transport regulator)
MPDHLSVEELVIDDSFINYCFQKNEADSLYWEQYVSDYPFERKKIEEAKQMVLGLHVMLKQEHAEKRVSSLSLQQETKSFSKIFSIKKIFRYAAAIAAAFILMLAAKEIINVSDKTDKPTRQIAANKILDSEVSYKTANGEKKVITLSDDTKIWLNAGSELRIDERYGKENRKVYLSGEALFEVIHDESLPFIVYTDKYEVKDLGTVFNVKAYPGDKESETSLIRGKVEIKIANGKHSIFLSPNQKAVINGSNESEVKEKETAKSAASPDITLRPLSYNQKDSAVVETAWTQNRLEIVNEDFYEMKEKLERWFNVKIIINDNEVGKYPFTATFDKEDIQQVLQALQYAYHFNYTIKSNEVNISK